MNDDCPQLEPVMKQSREWREQVKEKPRQLNAMEQVTKFLQKRNLQLAEVMKGFDIVLSQNIAAGFEGINMDPSYLNLTNDVFSDSDFLTGVTKLQRDQKGDLSEQEKLALRPLLRPRVPTVNTVQSVEEEGDGDFFSTLNSLNETPVDEYIDTSFIVASAVEVERLWIIAGNVLTSNRNKMLPTLMQVIIFLKVNRDMWNEDTVYQSIINSKNTERERRSRRAVALEERVNFDEAKQV